MNRTSLHVVSAIVTQLSKPLIAPYTLNPESLTWVQVGAVMDKMQVSRNTAKRYLFAASDAGYIQCRPGPTRQTGWQFKPVLMTHAVREYFRVVDIQWYMWSWRLVETNRINWHAFERLLFDAEYLISPASGRKYKLDVIPDLTPYGDHGILMMTEQGENPTGVSLPGMSEPAT